MALDTDESYGIDVEIGKLQAIISLLLAANARCVIMFSRAETQFVCPMSVPPGVVRFPPPSGIAPDAWHQCRYCSPRRPHGPLPRIKTNTPS